MNTMTIMKKTYIKWCFLGILILLTISLVIYLNYQNSKKTKFLNYPVNYSICNSNEVLVKVYCNRKNLSFLDKDNIVKSNIMDEEQNTYLVKINKISNEKKLENPDFLTHQKNGLLLNKHQIEVLERFQIPWKNYTTYSSLVYELEEILLEESDEELELIANQLQEFSYYSEVNK